MADPISFGDFLDRRIGDKASGIVTLSEPPAVDQAAKALSIGKKLDQPPEFIRQDVPTFEQQVEKQRKQGVVVTSPSFAQFIAQNPVHAEAAGNADEWEKLGAWERSTRAIQSGIESTQANRTRAAAATFGTDEELKAARGELEKAGKPLEDAEFRYKLLSNVAGGITDLFASASQGGATGAVAGAATGAVAGGVGAAPGAVAGGILGTAVDAATVAYGTSWDDLSQAEEKAGVKINPYVKTGAAAIVGGLTFAADKFSLGAGSGFLKAVAGDTASALVARGLVGTMGAATAAVGKGLAVDAAVGAGTQAAVRLTEDVAKAVTDGSFETVYNNEEARAAAVEEMLLAAVSQSAFGTAGRLPGIGVDIHADRARAKQATADLEKHKKIRAEAEGLETYTKAPEAFNAFAKQVLGDREVEVSPAALDVPGVMEELRTLVPDFEEKLARTRASGADMAVDYADLLAKASPELDAALQPHLRFEPDGVTQVEAEGFEAWHGTPHAFDRFDYSKIGTGEGAQAYGYGLYFAGKKGIAEDYQRTLSEPSTYFAQFSDGSREELTNSPLLPFFKKGQTDLDAIIAESETRVANRLEDDAADLEEFRRRIVDLEKKDDSKSRSELRILRDAVDQIESNVDLKREQEKLEAAKALKEKGAVVSVQEGGGNLYRVAIKVKPEELLDYDKPLQEQPEAVTAALQKAGIEVKQNVDESTPHALYYNGEIINVADQAFTGSSIVDTLSARLGDAEASRVLREAGIPGLRYLDASSRKQTFTVTSAVDGKKLSEQEGKSQTFDSKKAAEEYVDEVLGYDMTAETVGDYVTITENKVDQTRNIVLFSDDRVEITERNGQPVERPLTFKVPPKGAAVPQAAPAQTPAEIKAHGPGLPPPAEGMVRVFHGGTEGSFTGEGGRWFINDYEYARDYRQVGPEGVWYVDLPRDHKMFDTEYPDEQGPAQGFTFSTELPEADIAGARRVVDAAGDMGVSQNETPIPPTPTESAQAEALATAVNEARAAKQELWLYPLFTSADAVGMDKTRFARYSKRLSEDLARNQEAAIRASTNEASRRLTKEWKAAYKEELAVATEAIAARPAIEAYEFLVNGRWIRDGTKLEEGAKIKLSKAAVAELTDQPLPRGATAAKGIHPDVAAELFRYATGKDLVDGLAGLERTRGEQSVSQWKKTQAASIADTATEAKLGSLDEKIAREAFENALFKTQKDLLSDELAALGEEVGAPPFDETTVITNTEMLFKGERLKKALNIKSYTRAVASAGREAEMAFLKGTRDVIGAFKAKQDQFRHHTWASESQQLVRQKEKFDKRVKRLGSKKSFDGIDQHYTDQIHYLLAKHGLSSKRDPQELGARQIEMPLARFAEGRNDLIVADSLLTDSRVEDLNELNVEQFRDLDNAIKSLENAGRKEKHITLKGKQEDYQETRNELVTQLRTLPRRKRQESAEDGLVRRVTNETLDKVDGFRYVIDSWLTQVKNVFRDMDGGKAGPFVNKVYRMLLEADGSRKDLMSQVNEEVRKINESIPKGMNTRISQKLILDESREFTQKDGTQVRPPMVLNRMDLAVIALNMGNAGNAERLIHGQWPETKGDIPAYIARREEVNALLDKEMRPEDWDYVEKIWTLFEQLAPLVETKSRERTGVSATMVRPQPRTLASGRQIKGGYYPIFDDPDIAGHQRPTDLLEPRFTAVSTNTSHLKDRVGGSAPLHIKNAGGRLHGQVAQVVDDLTMHDAVKDVWRLLDDSLVRKEINLSIGREYGDKFKDWLQLVANRHQEYNKLSGPVENLLRGLRGNITVAYLGLNPSVMFTPGLGDVARNLMSFSPRFPREALRYIMGDEGAWKTAWENSPELRHWEDGYSQDMNRLLAMPSSAIKKKLAVAAFKFSIAVEKAAGHVDWTVSYNTAKQKGMDHEDAVFYAENRLRNNFARQSPLDLAPVLMGSEFQKIFIPFYGFLSFAYNKKRQVYQDVKNKEFNEALVGMVSFVLLPALLGLQYFDAGQEEDDSLAEQALKVAVADAASTVPGARELYSKLVLGYPASNNPIVRYGEVATKTGSDLWKIYNDEEPSDTFLKNMLYFGGMTAGVPMGWGKTAQFLYDYRTGEQDPQGAIEWWRGLNTGQSEKYAK